MSDSDFIEKNLNHLSKEELINEIKRLNHLNSSFKYNVHSDDLTMGALIESEIRYQNLLESASEAILILDLKNRVFIDANSNAEKLLKYPKEQFLLMGADDISPKYQSSGKISKELFEGLIERVLNGGRIAVEWDHLSSSKEIVRSELKLAKMDTLEGTYIRYSIINLGEKKKYEEQLSKIAASLSMESDKNFFESLVLQMSLLLEADFVYIGSLSESKNKIKTLALSKNNALSENFEYELKDTPCEIVMEKGICFYPNNVQSLFPKDLILAEFSIQGYLGSSLIDSNNKPLGIVVALYKKPAPQVSVFQATMKIFASRITSELSRKKIMESLKEEKERLSMALSSADMGIWSWNIIEDKFSFSKDLIENQDYNIISSIHTLNDYINIVHEIDRDKVKQTIHNILSNPSSEFKILHRIVTESNKIRWIESKGKVIKDDLYKPVRMTGVFYDITKNKDYEDSLKASEEKYKNLFEKTGLASLIINFKGDILMANQLAAYLFEKNDKNELVNHNIKDIFPEEIYGKYTLKISNILKTGQGEVTEDTIKINNDVKRFFLSNLYPIKNSYGEIESIMFLANDITEFKKAEETIIMREELIHSLVQDVDIGLLIQSPTTEILLHNNTAKELLGINEDLVGKLTNNLFLSVIHEDGSIFPPPYQPVQQAIVTGQASRQVTMGIYRKTKNDIVWLIVSAVPRLNSDGTVKHIVCSLANITNRRQTEEALKLSEQRFKIFYNLASEALFILDKESFKILDINSAFTRLFGYSERESTGMHCSKLLAESFFESFHYHTMNKSDEAAQFIGIKKNGITFPFIGNHKLLNYQNREVFFISILDITSLKEAEELRSVNHEITVRNKLIELQKQELEVTLANLKKTQDQLIQSEKLAALGQLIAGVAHEINNPIGAIQASSLNIMDCLNEVKSLLPEIVVTFNKLPQSKISLIIDLITKGASSNDQLTGMEHRRKKKEIINILANHNISNNDSVADTIVDLGLYNSIEPLLELLSNNSSDVIFNYISQVVLSFKNAKTIKMAVDRASKIIYALKNFSHFNSSSEKVIANIQENIETVLTIYHNQLKKGVEIIKNYEKVPDILCYPDDLLHLWTNLIYNAIQAMNYSGTIIIDIRQEKKEIVVAITDSGHGIPEEIQEKIFLPFFTTKPSGEGSGIGLDIVRKIIDKHKGNISFTSVPGKTKFEVRLPID